MTGPIFRLGAEASLWERVRALLVCLVLLWMDWLTDPFPPIWLSVGFEILVLVFDILYYHIVPWFQAETKRPNGATAR